MRIVRADLPIETMALAKALLGMRLVRMSEGVRVSGQIVEVEAYPPGDEASHAFRGLRPRCRSMFLPHGHVYVYRIYGMCYCINISSEIAGVGSAVLLRALEPLEGLEMMRERRKTVILRDLTCGPGRLTQALGIGLECDGLDLDTSADLFLEHGITPGEIAMSPRIGISVAQDKVWRFYLPHSTQVSGRKAFNAAWSSLGESLRRNL